MSKEKPRLKIQHHLSYLKTFVYVIRDIKKALKNSFYF